MHSIQPLDTHAPNGSTLHLDQPPTQAWRAGTYYVPALVSDDDPCVQGSKLLLVWNVGRDDDDEFIPPGAKHLKGTALFTSQSIPASLRG
jgi:hypothetical protein